VNKTNKNKLCVDVVNENIVFFLLRDLYQKPGDVMSELAANGND
jgi:hypothetical protein